jgi:hypothetical protein
MAETVTLPELYSKPILSCNTKPSTGWGDITSPGGGANLNLSLARFPGILRKTGGTPASDFLPSSIIADTHVPTKKRASKAVKHLGYRSAYNSDG